MEQFNILEKDTLWFVCVCLLSIPHIIIYNMDHNFANGKDDV